MYDDDTSLVLEIQYQVIQELLVKFGRYPTKDEVAEAVVCSLDDHMQPNVIVLN